VASGNGKGQIFVKARSSKPSRVADLETLIEEAMRLAEQMTTTVQSPGADGVGDLSRGSKRVRSDG